MINGRRCGHCQRDLILIGKTVGGNEIWFCEKDNYLWIGRNGDYKFFKLQERYFTLFNETRNKLNQLTDLACSYAFFSL